LLAQGKKRGTSRVNRKNGLHCLQKEREKLCPKRSWRREGNRPDNHLRKKRPWRIGNAGELDACFQDQRKKREKRSLNQAEKGGGRQPILRERGVSRAVSGKRDGGNSLHTFIGRGKKNRPLNPITTAREE